MDHEAAVQRELAEARGVGAFGTHNETPAAPPAAVDTGDRNWVTGSDGVPKLAADSDPETPAVGGLPLTPADVPAPDDAASPPAKSANKPEWVEHAVAQGVPRDEAEGKTKEQLIEDHG